MYKTKGAGKQNFKQQNEILTQPTLVQKSVLAKVYNNRTKRIWEVMFASKHTRVEIQSKSIPTFRKNLRFSASFHSIHEKVFPAKYHKVGKGLEKVLHSASKTKKKEIWTKTFYEAVFSSSYEQSYSKTVVFWRFRFYIPNIVRVWKLGWWKKFFYCC